MTPPSPAPTRLARITIAAACAIVLSSGLAACSSSSAGAGPTKNTSVDTVKKMSAQTPPHDFKRDPHCFRGGGCPR